MKIYYAHAICVYGTSDEEKEIEHIRKNFPDHDILNPGLCSDPEKRDTMDYYKTLVSGCDALVFTRILGKITSGVGIEINHALAEKKSVFELKNGKIKPVKRQVKYISRKETVSLYGKYQSKNGRFSLNSLLSDLRIKI